MIIEQILDRQQTSLSEEILFCRKCVNSNQRPRLLFDEDGVCDACRFAEEKGRAIDWNERERQLEALLDRFRSSDGNYDVIVPSSGGKDSCYVAHQLKYKYGMHPLCVTWAPAMYTDIGWENLQNAARYFDTELYMPNREIHGKLTRLGFELVGDPFEPWHYGQRAFPLHAALQHDLRLVMYGENTGAEYGGRPESRTSPVESLQDKKVISGFRYDGGVDTLIRFGLEAGYLNDEDAHDGSLAYYRIPRQEDLTRCAVEMHWFSFYKEWIPQENYYYAVEECGFKPNSERSEGTYSKYASLDDKTDGLHFYMQFIKFGFGRCTSDAAQEIRSGIITREEAVALVHKYDGEFPKRYHAEVLAYMEMTEDEFRATVDKFRLPHVWKRDGGSWKVRRRVS